MRADQKFWLVWMPDGGPPEFRHETEASALAEAERRASLRSGQTLFVLEAKTMVSVSDIMVTPLRSSVISSSEELEF